MMDIHFWSDDTQAQPKSALAGKTGDDYKRKLDALKARFPEEHDGFVSAGRVPLIRTFIAKPLVQSAYARLFSDQCHWINEFLDECDDMRLLRIENASEYEKDENLRKLDEIIKRRVDAFSSLSEDGNSLSDGGNHG